MTRTFKNPEELMMALLQGEKWQTEKYIGVCSYNKEMRSFGRIRYPNGFYFGISAHYDYCDGKTLWHKVEEKTGLNFKKEKYASGDYILLFYNGDSWVTKFITSWNYTEDVYKLIHKKHKNILDAYLADNSVMIEFRNTDGSMKEFEYIGSCLKGGFIDSYNEAFEYRLKPKKKTIELAMFTCCAEIPNMWIIPAIYGDLQEFKENYKGSYTNHHEIPNTRYELEIEDEGI